MASKSKKRANYYEVHKNKEPRKIKFKTVIKKHIKFSVFIDVSKVNKAIKKAVKSIDELSKTLNNIEVKSVTNGKN